MMTTTLKELRFGIEIETAEVSGERLAEAIMSVTGGELVRGNSRQVRDPQGRVWKAVRDSSIRTRNGQAAEFVSPVLTYDDLPMLQDIVRAMRRAGAKVNSSCGLHIHIDAAPFNAKQLSNLAKLVYKQEPLIMQALGVTSERQGRWTQPMRSEFIDRIEQRRAMTMDGLNEDWYGRRTTNPTHYDTSRYYGVNFHNVWYRGTVEFRYFESTLHAGEVKAYLHLCLAMAAKALNARAAVSEQRTYRAESAKYDFRCFLLRLKMIGPEFKNTRMHLLKKMPGSAAWKNGRPTTNNND